MKKYWLLVICNFIFSFYSDAQTFEKSYQIAGMGLTANKGIMLSDGNIIQVGHFSPTNSFRDLFVTKIRSTNGDTIWAKSFHANGVFLTAMNVVEIDKNNLMITANGTDSGTNNNFHRVVYLQLDSNGSLLQSKTYNVTGNYSNMYSTGLRLLPQQQLISLSVSYDSLGMLIQKFDPNGNFQFSKSILLTGTGGLTNGNLYDVVRKGDAYYFVGNANYDSNSPDLLLVKTDTLGNVQWVKSSFSGINATLYIVSGQFINTNDNSICLALGSGVSTSFVRMDTSGVISSFITYSNSSNSGSIFQPYLKSVFQLANGDILFGGITDMQMNVNLGTHVGRPFLLRTDSIGNILWSKKYAEGSNFNAVTFCGQSAENNFWIGGSAFDFVTLAPSSSHPRLYLMKLDSLGHVGSNICGNDTVFSLNATIQTKVLNNKSFIENNASNLINLPLTESAIHPNITNLGMSTSLGILIQPSVICQGGNAIISATNLINPGTNPVFNFYVNNVLMQSGNATVYNTTALNNGDLITCEIVSNASCVAPATATSPIITAAIYPNVNPSISISANPSTTVNAGSPILFTASVTNAGPNPFYSWKKNGLNVWGNSSTYYLAAPANGDVITCTVTSSACAPNSIASSNALTLTVNGSSGILNNSLPEISISVFPNPVVKEINIDLGSVFEGQLILRNMVGTNCFSQFIQGKSFTINPPLATGVYELVIISKNGVGRTKFIKQ